MTRVATAVLEARGAFQNHPARRKDREGEPKAKGVGPAPDYLAEDERAVWDEVVSNCAAGVWQSGDRGMLETLVRLLAESRRDWDKFPVRRLTIMVRLLGMAGMTPADRSRVYVRPKERQGVKQGLDKYLS